MGPGENVAVVTYLATRIHLKSFFIFPLKVAATYIVVQERVQQEHSHIVNVGVKLACPFELSHWNPDIWKGF